MSFIHKTTYLFLTVSFGIIIDSNAQSNDADEIMKVVSSIFVGMATNNGELVTAAFTDDATMFTVFIDAEGQVQKRAGSVTKFAEAVNAPKEKTWNEPIWNEKVQIDGPLASVWVDYAFYLDKEFLHCGVDSFDLIRTKNGWKVFNLIDTRRKSDCEVPESVREKFEN